MTVSQLIEELREIVLEHPRASQAELIYLEQGDGVRFINHIDYDQNLNEVELSE